MRSQLADRLGVQEPTLQHLPPDVHSLDAAEEAIELADRYGVCDGFPLSESQRSTLRGAGWASVRDGSWAASVVADFKPRQGGGKSDTIAARELAGLILFGERLIIHTAHEFPTANESFLRLVAVFDRVGRPAPARGPHPLRQRRAGHRAAVRATLEVPGPYGRVGSWVRQGRSGRLRRGAAPARASIWRRRGRRGCRTPTRRRGMPGRAVWRRR